MHSRLIFLHLLIRERNDVERGSPCTDGKVHLSGGSNAKASVGIDLPRKVTIFNLLVTRTVNRHR